VSYGRDLFTPDRAGEAERVDYGALTYDGFTRARLTALGVVAETPPGRRRRCLDVGAGTGTISEWLADAAGVEEVVALDRDPRFVHARPDGRLRTLVADVTDPTLAPGRFDLVHCRFVLMHLPEHAEVLARLADWVAPGGWLVVGDAIDLTTADSPHPAYRQTMAAMWCALRERIGTDITWVTRYPRLLRQLGLQDVGAEVLLPPLLPDAPITAFWKTTWVSMRDALEQRIEQSADQRDEQDPDQRDEQHPERRAEPGPDQKPDALAPGVLDEALDYLSSPALADLSPGMICAWGRRPLG